jgi:hypothetical protein
LTFEPSAVIWIAYIGSGLIMPIFYYSQIRVCWQDTSGLPAYSMSKATIHVLCRLLMLPYIVSVGSPTMTLIVGLDLFGRCVELVVATVSLRRVGWKWHEISTRTLSLDFRRPAFDVPAPVDSATSLEIAAVSSDQDTAFPSAPGLAPLCEVADGPAVRRTGF